MIWPNLGTIIGLYIVGIAVWTLAICPLLGRVVAWIGHLMGLDYFVVREGDEKYIGFEKFVPTYWSHLILGLIVTGAVIVVTLLILLAVKGY